MNIKTDRESVERLLEGVTPGPWSFHDKGIHPHQYICAPSQAYEFGQESPVVAYVVGTDSDANRRFIAAARDLVPVLLAERDAALAEVARLQERLSAEMALYASASADRDEERKLADDLAGAFRATLEAIGPDAVRSNSLDRHAARRKAETLAKHGSKT